MTLTDELLAGRYKLKHSLGSGGFGTVYLGFDTILERDVAIKFIKPEFAGNADYLARFEREVRLIIQLEHPHIVPVYDYGPGPSQVFLVMRLFRDGTLANLLHLRGRLPLIDVIYIFEQICQAVARTHQLGIVHRDLKPANVMMAEGLFASLTDFGIARDMAAGSGSITGTGDLMVGTPGYMSPEQINGTPITAQTDIYSLGIMLYELLSGKVPFEGTPIQISLHHLNDPVPLLALPDCPPEVDLIIQRATAKSPNDRYRQVMDMAEDLKQLLPGVVPRAESAVSPDLHTEPDIPPDGDEAATPPRQQSIPTTPIQRATATGDQRHVFISYAREESSFVQRLRFDLERSGIDIWIDQDDLVFGTPDWDEAIRQAIREARAVLYIGSPDARRSRYVRDEISMANAGQRPIFPVWAVGAEWLDCIPLGMGSLQYLDARDNRYERVLPRILEALHNPEAFAAPPSSKPPSDFIPRNPYKGLMTFQSDDHRDFFGRTLQIEELIQALNSCLRSGQPRWLGLIGASGSGKSSVIQAGLLPKLQAHASGITDSPGWIYAPRLTPGEHPVKNLAAALQAVMNDTSLAIIQDELTARHGRGLHRLALRAAPRVREKLVLFIDQFEEIFSQTALDERAQFITLLTTAATIPDGRVIVILTMRADFYQDAMQHIKPLELLERYSKPVLPLEIAELYEVIEGPAKLPDVRLEFDPGLVAEMVYEIRDEAGGLTLLEFALDRLYQHRDGARITRDAYEAIGGVRGALSEYADEVYRTFTPDEQRTFQKLFLQLVQQSTPQQKPTRRQATFTEFQGTDPDVRKVLDQLIKSRLLMAGNEGTSPTVEISHEALLNYWEQARDWLREHQSYLIWRDGFARETTTWIENNRDSSYLAVGSKLEEARRWTTAYPENVRSHQQDFLRLSRRQHQRNQRLRFTFIALTTLITLGVLLVGANQFRLQQQARVTTYRFPPATVILDDGTPLTLNAFAMELTEVSYRQYRLCVEAGACTRPLETENAEVKFDTAPDDLPVAWVNAHQAYAYCRWQGGRLPTVAEWEYAAYGAGADRRRYP